MGTIAGGLASIAGGVIGNEEAQGAQGQDTAAQQAALQQYLNLNAPSIQEQQLALQQEQLAGNLNPNLVGTQQNGASALNAIQTDPRLVQAQMNTLSQLGALSQGGLNDQDRAALMQIANQAKGQSQAQQAAIMQNMASRGLAGGGAELAARLSASQNAANMNANMGLGVASQEQARANQALNQQGALAQSMQAQQFGQAAQQAASQNAINQFNTNLRQQAANTNTAAQNQAQLFNLQNAQNVANTNTGIANQQQAYNSGLYQQQYNNQLAAAKGTAGAEQNLGNYYGQEAAGTRGMWSGIGQGVGQIFGSGGVGGIINGSSSGGATPGNDAGQYSSSGVTPSQQYQMDSGANSSLSMPEIGSSASGGAGAAGYSLMAHGGMVSAPNNAYQGSIPEYSGNIAHAYANGGPVESEDTRQEKARHFVKGATASGYTPATWWDNIKAGFTPDVEPSPAPSPAYADGGIVTSYPHIPHYAQGGFSDIMQYAPLLAFLKDGGVVPGKAKVQGDSVKNDIVPAILSPNEVVVPRSHTKTAEDAKDYIDNLFAAMGKHNKP